jgi:hypothetical protein
MYKSLLEQLNVAAEQGKERLRLIDRGQYRPKVEVVRQRVAGEGSLREGSGPAKPR